jgi:hypothetical protein
LRHQLNVLRRNSPKRLTFGNFDRLVFPLSICAAHCRCLVDRRTRDGHPLASSRFSFVWRWKSRRRVGRPKVDRDSTTDQGNEPGQSALGRSQNPWRTPQTRHWRRPSVGRQIHGKDQEAAVPGLEDAPAQRCPWNRIDRSVCGSDHLIPAAIRFVDSTARQTPNLGWVSRPVRRQNGLPINLPRPADGSPR